jgi:hypothetical protein
MTKIDMAISPPARPAFSVPHRQSVHLGQKPDDEIGRQDQKGRDEDRADHQRHSDRAFYVAAQAAVRQLSKDVNPQSIPSGRNTFKPRKVERSDGQRSAPHKSWMEPAYAIGINTDNGEHDQRPNGEYHDV